MWRQGREFTTNSDQTELRGIPGGGGGRRNAKDRARIDPETAKLEATYFVNCPYNCVLQAECRVGQQRGLRLHLDGVFLAGKDFEHAQRALTTSTRAVFFAISVCGHRRTNTGRRRGEPLTPTAPSSAKTNRAVRVDHAVSSESKPTAILPIGCVTLTRQQNHTKPHTTPRCQPARTAACRSAMGAWALSSAHFLSSRIFAKVTVGLLGGSVVRVRGRGGRRPQRQREQTHAPRRSAH